MLEQPPGVVASALGIADEERVAIERVRALAVGGAEVVGAALGDEALATAPGGTVVVLRRAEQDPPRAPEPDALRHLQVPELARCGQRRPGLPAAEVVRPGLPDDPAGIVRSVAGARGHQHLEAIAVALDPGVAPRRVLVPARVGAQQHPLLLPLDQVVGGRAADALDRARLRMRDAGVEQVPAVVVAQDAPGPGRQVVEGARPSRQQRVGQHPPATQVTRHRMPDGGVVMAQLRIPERARRLQVEDVHILAVAREPEVPEPVPGQPQAHIRRR